MDVIFVLMLLLTMAIALGSGFPVAFALPGSAILTIGTAALAGWIVADDPSAYFAQGGPVEWLTAGVTNFRGVYWEVERDTLIAIPLFVFMGIMLQRSRIAENLLVTMAQLFGPLPGGLGISVIFVGALLAATTGIVGATVVAMGLISLPAMMRSKYSNALSTGTIAASGTLGQIIPPSIVLIILADQLSSATDQASNARKALYKVSTGEFSMPTEFDTVSTSAGDMFMGALVPGLLLVAAYMIFVLVLALMRPKLAPAVHYEGKLDRQFAFKVFVSLVPPLTLIFIVLGSIITGVATVNQAGAIGAVGAMIMAGARLHEGRRDAYWPALLAIGSVFAMGVIASIAPVNVKNLRTTGDMVALVLVTIAVVAFVVSLVWSGLRTLRVENTLRSVMIDTAKTTSLVFIILLGAAMLTASFRAFGGESLVRDFLTTLPGGFWAQFVTVMAVIFFLGFFLDFIEISVVVVPIVAPIILMDPGANVTAVWLGVMIGLNIQTSFLTPPFGFALFYLRGVAPPSVKTIQMYRGVVAFICLQLIVLGIVAVNPRLVNYLPTRISLLSETAPPPLNPKLQTCLEERVIREYDRDGATIRKAIETARGLDYSMVPQQLRSAAEGALDKAEKTFPLVAEIKTAEAAVQAQTDAYRPLHVEVRSLQQQAHRVEEEIKVVQRRLDQLGYGPKADPARKQVLQARIDALEAERKAILAEVPARWEADHKAFQALQKAELNARRAYRRNVDEAYAPISELVATVAAADALAKLEGEFATLRKSVESAPPAENVDRIADLAKKVGEIKGTNEIRSALSNARRVLRNQVPDQKEAAESMAKAEQLLGEEVAWRQRAKTALLPGLQAYEATIRDTIGVRLQSKLTRDQALDMASCTSAHRDISLHF
ncbi:MAG: TRAP transporter large permease subunit [Betaproteobacteria bacterium]|jgi:tripartite ATP-independent transporter DctM subunit|nr:TRAP transporter large permease subunit [Betaproteobacteria bacterium]